MKSWCSWWRESAIEGFLALFITFNPGSGFLAFLFHLRIPNLEDKDFSVLMEVAEYFWIFLSPFQQSRSRSYCTDDRNFFFVRGVQFIK